MLIFLISFLAIIFSVILGHNHCLRREVETYRGFWRSEKEIRLKTQKREQKLLKNKKKLEKDNKRYRDRLKKIRQACSPGGSNGH